MSVINLTENFAPAARAPRGAPRPRLAPGEELFPDELEEAERQATAAYADALARFQQAMEAFEAMVDGNEWWAKVRAYRASASYDPAVYAARWTAAKSGPNAPICAAWEALEALCDEHEDARLRFVAAQAALLAARDAGAVEIAL